MNTREFIITANFDKQWDKLSLNDEALRQLQNYIILNSGIGDIIEGTGGLVKLRWKLPFTGKSGGIRVLYVDFMRRETVVLVNCYSKSEKDNISDKEKAMYKDLIKEIEKRLEQ